MGTGIANALGVQWGQSTPSTQSLLGRGTTVRRKRRKVAKSSRRAKTARKTTKRRAGKARLVKGSAAAKRYMAKIRRKRRK